jgi:hypothetical protein
MPLCIPVRNEAKTMTNPTVRNIETFPWESEVLRTENAEDALFALSKLAGIDPLQLRADWTDGATQSRVRNHRRILLAYLRRLRHKQPEASYTAAVHEVMTWMLLVTECEFSAAHKSELIAGIRNDPCYVKRDRYRQLPASSGRHQRLAALEMLLTDLESRDTSNYVPKGPRSLFAWLRHKVATRPGTELQPFSHTDIHL